MRFFPNALKAYQQGLAFPLFNLMCIEQIKYISICMDNIVSQNIIYNKFY
jgi:hypothetical protein